MTLDFRSISVAGALSAMVALGALTGCGAGMLSTPASLSPSAVSGIVHGGPNPVRNATVKLYSTGSTGYGQGATLLATATTDNNGYFTFPANTCVANSEVYATVAGGETGASTANASSVLMAALGDCANVSASTQIWISEATTVAAGYALSNFINITGSGSATAVNIGAPANNSATTPACTGSGSAMVCTANGLEHAFKNALNIANSVTTANGAPNGTVYITTPSNPNGTVPAALVNSIANSVEACVNSSGGANSTDGSNCGNLFSDTVSGTTLPTNTLQAVINLARNPTQNVTAIYNLAAASAYYEPTLTVAPPDYSLAIVYTGATVGGTTTPMGTVYPLALDYNDNVYALSYKTTAILESLGSDGASRYVYTDATYTYPRFLAVDTNQNVFFSNNRPSTGTVSDVVQISAAGTFANAITIGAPGMPYGVAVDKFNNVFTTAEASTAISQIFEIPSGTTTATALASGGTPYTFVPYAYNLAIDSSADLWTIASASATNGGTVSNALVSNALPTTATPSYQGLSTTTEDATLPDGYGITFDSAANAWVNNYTTLYEVAVTPKSVTVAGGVSTVSPASVPSSTALAARITNGTVSATDAEFSTIDGANNIYLPEYNKDASYLWQYLASTGTFTAMNPCAIATGATVCNAGTAAGSYPALYNANSAVVDATGTVWVSDYTAGAVVQVIGTATPSWPQLSYAHQGKEPQ